MVSYPASPVAHEAIITRLYRGADVTDTQVINTTSVENTSGACTFLRRVLTMNSRASDCTGAGSSGRSTMLLSSGSPGTICQWSKTLRQNACPCAHHHSRWFH